jgi:hypothetical protein
MTSHPQVGKPFIPVSSAKDRASQISEFVISEHALRQELKELLDEPMDEYVFEHRLGSNTSGLPFRFFVANLKRRICI